ncbi:hypothetical protein [Cupriavidus basilensis]
MLNVTFQTASIFLETHYLPGDIAELRLPCDAVTVTDVAISVKGIETRHIQAMNWLAEYLSFESDGNEFRFRVARPAVMPPLNARFPRR